MSVRFWAVVGLMFVALAASPQASSGQTDLNLPPREADAVRSLAGVKRVYLRVEIDPSSAARMNTTGDALAVPLRTLLTSNGVATVTEAQWRANRAIPQLRLRIFITAPGRGQGDPVDSSYLYSLTLSALQYARLERARSSAPYALPTWRMEEIGVTETKATPENRRDFLQPRWNQFFAAFLNDWKKANRPAPPSKMPAR